MRAGGNSLRRCRIQRGHGVQQPLILLRRHVVDDFRPVPAVVAGVDGNFLPLRLAALVVERIARHPGTVKCIFSNLFEAVGQIDVRRSCIVKCVVADLFHARHQLDARERAVCKSILPDLLDISRDGHFTDTGICKSRLVDGGQRIGECQSHTSIQRRIERLFPDALELCREMDDIQASADCKSTMPVLQDVVRRRACKVKVEAFDNQTGESLYTGCFGK